MKFNLKNFYFRNKQVLLFLGAVFLGVMIFISFYKIKEGFDNSSIGEYAYLAPVPANNTWSQATQDAFLPIYTKTVKDNGGGGVPPITDTMKVATEEEGKYYISNKKWPWGSYITTTVKNLLIANRDKQLGVPGGPTPETIDYAGKYADVVQSFVSTRSVYTSYFSGTESKETPQPLSYQIFMGTDQPPADASSASSVYSMTGLSSADYQSLTSICKNVLGQK